MTVPEQEFLASVGVQVAALVVQALKDEGLVHDDRPPLTLKEAAARLNVSDRVIGDMTRGKDGEPPVLATVKVIPGGHKGIMVEPAEIDRYLEQQRRLSWTAAAREETR